MLLAKVGWRCLLLPQRTRSSALVSLQEGVDIHVVFFEAGADIFEGFVDAVGELEHLVFLFVDSAPVDHGLPVEDLVPVFAAVNEDDVLLGEFPCLEEREHFPKLVHSAKTAGENDQGFGDLREPELAHEEVVKIKAELRADVSVRELLVGQLDGETDRFATGFDGAAIGGLHDTGPAAGTNYEAARPGA